MQDEILAHRLGLVPLNVNPFSPDYQFQFKDGVQCYYSSAMVGRSYPVAVMYT